jgi:hypothetical protein
VRRELVALGCSGGDPSRAARWRLGCVRGPNQNVLISVTIECQCIVFWEKYIVTYIQTFVCSPHSKLESKVQYL